MKQSEWKKKSKQMCRYWLLYCRYTVYVNYKSGLLVSFAVMHPTAPKYLSNSIFVSTRKIRVLYLCFWNVIEQDQVYLFFIFSSNRTRYIQKSRFYLWNLLKNVIDRKNYLFLVFFPLLVYSDKFFGVNRLWKFHWHSCIIAYSYIPCFDCLLFFCISRRFVV